MRKLSILRNENGITYVEILAYASVGIILAVAISQLALMFRGDSQEKDLIQEAADQIESRLQDAFSYNFNDCPRLASDDLNQKDESLVLHTINLYPGEAEAVLPDLEARGARSFEDVSFDPTRGNEMDQEIAENFEIEEDDEEDTIVALDDADRMEDGQVYEVDTSDGPQFVRLTALRVNTFSRSNVSVLNASMQALNSRQLPIGRAKDIQVSIRTVRAERDTVCWATVNKEAEKCHENGGLPVDEFGKCSYQTKESLARATCGALAGMGEIKNTVADLTACKLGFMRGASGAAQAL